MGDISDKVDKAHESKSLSDLADAPVGTLQGVSDSDAEHLKAAFNIATVRDLGTNKLFLGPRPSPNSLSNRGGSRATRGVVPRADA